MSNNPKLIIFKILSQKKIFLLIVFLFIYFVVFRFIKKSTLLNENINDKTRKKMFRYNIY